MQSCGSPGARVDGPGVSLFFCPSAHELKDSHLCAPACLQVWRGTKPGISRHHIMTSSHGSFRKKKAMQLSQDHVEFRQWLEPYNQSTCVLFFEVTLIPRATSRVQLHFTCSGCEQNAVHCWRELLGVGNRMSQSFIENSRTRTHVTGAHFKFHTATQIDRLRTSRQCSFETGPESSRNSQTKHTYCHSTLCHQCFFATYPYFGQCINQFSVLFHSGSLRSMSKSRELMYELFSCKLS